MRILIADVQAKVRFALRVLLERLPGCEVVGEASSSDDLLAHMQASQPDVVLLGWELPHPAKGELVAALREICPNLAVIALSGRPEARTAALEAAADAFVSKGDPPEHLLAALEKCGCTGQGAACRMEEQRTNQP